MKTKLYIQIYSRILETDIIQRSMWIGCLLGSILASLFIILATKLLGEPPWYVMALLGVIYILALMLVSKTATMTLARKERRKISRDDRA